MSKTGSERCETVRNGCLSLGTGDAHNWDVFTCTERMSQFGHRRCTQLGCIHLYGTDVSVWAQEMHTTEGARAETTGYKRVRREGYRMGYSTDAKMRVCTKIVRTCCLRLVLALHALSGVSKW